MSNKEILAVDIGNTSAHFAYYNGRRFSKEFRIKSSEIKKKAALVMRQHIPAGSTPAVVIASVVPSAGRALKAISEQQLGYPAYRVGKDLAVPIRNLYKKPRQVGADRLLSAYAAYAIYRRGLFVLDFGTAITVDVVSRRGEYLGGAIAPGIEISLEALFQKTALLPKITLKHPGSRIGRDTIESIRIGCSVGIGGLCDRLVESLQEHFLFKPLVIATGGYAHFMRRYCHSFQKIEPNLVLKGILWSFLAQTKNTLRKCG